MESNRLRQIILDQREVFNRSKTLIERQINLDSYIETELVVVISGVRRCGKSTLLYLIKEKMNLDDSSYLYFNFEDERIIPKTKLLEELYLLHLQTYGKEPVLFLDEIQNVQGWEKFINRMYESGIKIFVSGSNAKMLSSEISTNLTGRNRVIELRPFSFNEFLMLKGINLNIEGLSSKETAQRLNNFDNYLKIGGFPIVVKENDTEILSSYFNDILFRDIIARFNITQLNQLKQMTLFLFSNIGKLFSYSSLQNVSGLKSRSSISNYLDYLSQSYLFYYLKRFDYSVKKQIMNSRKVYTIDTGFANKISFAFTENKGRLLENMVLNELLRRGKEVYYYSAKKECDFVIKQGLKIVEAIQVVYELNHSNEKREYEGLLVAMNAFNLDDGLILTYNTEREMLVDGKTIKLMPVWKWV